MCEVVLRDLDIHVPTSDLGLYVPTKARGVHAPGDIEPGCYSPDMPPGTTSGSDRLAERKNRDLPRRIGTSLNVVHFARHSTRSR